MAIFRSRTAETSHQTPPHISKRRHNTWDQPRKGWQALTIQILTRIWRGTATGGPTKTQKKQRVTSERKSASPNHAAPRRANQRRRRLGSFENTHRCADTWGWATRATSPCGTAAVELPAELEGAEREIDNTTTTRRVRYPTARACRPVSIDLLAEADVGLAARGLACDALLGGLCLAQGRFKFRANPRGR